MKAVLNEYNGIIPTFFKLVEFDRNEQETFGSCVLIEDGLVYVKENTEWREKYRLHISKYGTIYFEGNTFDLFIGKMHLQGFQVLKVKNFFSESEKKSPQLVLQVFDEIIRETEYAVQLEKILNNLNINLST